MTLILGWGIINMLGFYSYDKGFQLWTGTVIVIITEKWQKQEIFACIWMDCVLGSSNC